MIFLRAISLELVWLLQPARQQIIQVIFRIKKVISKISGAVFPVWTIVVTTESAAMARISSTIAALELILLP
jgi:hypothetical protein